MNKEWSELNKTMQAQIKKRDSFDAGIKTLKNLRNDLFDTILSFKEELSAEDFYAIPFMGADGCHSATIAWSLWHIFRIEDIVAHTLVAEDEQVFFKTLTTEDIEQIIDIELRDLKARAEEAGYKLTITPSAKRFVAEAGYDPAFGARPLKRAVMRYIEDPVSEFILSDRMLRRPKAAEGQLRTLKVGLTADKENTVVTLKEDKEA